MNENKERIMHETWAAAGSAEDVSLPDPDLEAGSPDGWV